VIPVVRTAIAPRVKRKSCRRSDAGIFSLCFVIFSSDKFVMFLARKILSVSEYGVICRPKRQRANCSSTGPVLGDYNNVRLNNLTKRR